jgi:hypothetical protein
VYIASQQKHQEETKQKLRRIPQMALSALLAALRNSGTDKEQREKKAKDLFFILCVVSFFPISFSNI